MANVKFDRDKVLGNSIACLSRQALCEFASKLCSAIKEDAGSGGYRGGVYPSNISMSENGELAIGPASGADWQGEELQYLAPELYWNGRRSPASDVYSVGMVMYFAASGGKLPFEDECSDAQLRRMSGAAINPPRAAGRRLGEIIAKAISFKAGDRYQSMDEMKTVLDSCNKNLFASGASTSEAVFGKSDDDLSDIERMMVDIMERGEINQEAPELPETVPDTPEEMLKPKPKAETREPRGEDVRIYTPSEDKSVEPEVIELREEKNPLIEPIVFSGARPGGVQYSKNLERERKIAEQVRKRRRRPVVFIGLLCAMLLVAAIIFNAMTRELKRADTVFGTPTPAETSAVSTPIVAPTPDPEVVSTPEPTAEPEPVREHTYKIFVEDVSWTVAQQRCEELGGHLVTISDVDELKIVTDLAEQYGVTRVWIGCRRIDGELTWVTGERITYYPWGRGEPSYVDSGDNVDEDYLLLWNHGGWSYNDSRNDPVADYPEMYSGNLAYVCEIDP